MESKSGAKLAGMSVMYGIVTGIVAFFAGVIAVFFGRFEGAGLCFLASAIAFGLLANAMYRD